MDGGAWWAAVHGVAKSQLRVAKTEQLHFHFSLSCIGEGKATHSSVLAWRIPGAGGAWWAAVSGVTQSQT